MAGGSGTGYIFRALAANGAIAISKGVGAVITGSAAMLAETLHSLSDCINQLLLLLGIRQARKPPSAKYPLGRGRELYFWSFMVAMLLFLGGGAYSMYEGIHKLQHPTPVDNPWLAIGILGGSLLLELWSMAGAMKAVNERRGDRPILKYLRETKDSDLVVITGEDFAACLGLALALAAVATSMVTGDPKWDAIGTLGIGVVLVGVAVFLAVEVKSLLVGEAADPVMTKQIQDIADDDPCIEKVLRCLTVQQGPGEIMVAMKLKMKADLTGKELVDAINKFEVRLQERMPEIKWSFVEPDHTDAD
jgi:cation diffusion facilitator family transporter